MAEKLVEILLKSSNVKMRDSKSVICKLKSMIANGFNKLLVSFFNYISIIFNILNCYFFKKISISSAKNTLN